METIGIKSDSFNFLVTSIYSVRGKEWQGCCNLVKRIFLMGLCFLGRIVSIIIIE